MGRKKKGRMRYQSVDPGAKEMTENDVSVAAPAPAATSLGVEVEWPEDQANQEKLLTSLKYQTLGPFLFSQKTLSMQAELFSVEANLLTREERVWPMFFDQPQWKKAVLVGQVVLTSLRLSETNQSFRDYLLKGHSSILKESMVAKVLKLHSEMMAEYSTAEVEVVYKVLRLQVSALGVGVSSPAYLFLDGLQDKEQLILPIKEAGNANFKEGKYRAAIGDYTRAIRIFPYSAVLYCNRALCYLRNGDTWSACVDSYRAIVLKPDWEKPYYRCSEAWMLLGNHATALRINETGSERCNLKSDLSRQRSEIVTAMETQAQESVASSETPPTDPAPSPMTSSVTGGGKTVYGNDGEESSAERAREKRRLVKARKKERRQRLERERERERGERSTSGSGAQDRDKNHGDVDMAKEYNHVHHESDTESSTTKQKPVDRDYHKTTVEGGVNHCGEGEVPEREPIEDENEWEFRHTSSACKSGGSGRMRLRELRSMFNLDQRPLPPGRDRDWLMNDDTTDDDGDDEEERGSGDMPRESSETRAQKEARELAAYRKRERERESLRAERQAMRTAEERKMAHTLPNPDPFTQFESLQTPTLDVDISTAKLFSMTKHVPSRQMIPQQYTAHSEAWCSLEPLPPLDPLIRPKPPATSFAGTFDEVWCPMLAGVTETADIIPPRIHYVGNMVTKYTAHYPPHYRRYEL